MNQIKRSKLKLVKGYGMSPQEPEGELDQAIARFLLARTAISKHTLRQYRRLLNQYRRLSPEWPPTPESIVKFIDYYQQADYAPDTIYTYYSILRGFIRFCIKRQLFTDDPLDEISGPRRPDNLPRAPLLDNLKKLTDYLEREVERVLGTKNRPYPHWGWREVRNLALYDVMLDSGLRVSEAVNVRLADVDLENWSIFVRRGKGTKQREAPLGRTGRADLKLWLAYRELIPIQAGDPGQDFLFLSHRRAWVPMSAAHAEKTLTRICKEAGIVPKITPHQLRHAFASLSHAAGASIGHVQQWLGHTEMGTTLRYLLTKESLQDHLKSSPRDHQL